MLQACLGDTTPLADLLNVDRPTVSDVMNIDYEDLDWAVEQDILSDKQAEQLWAALKERRGSATSTAPGLDLVSVAYYGGALVVIVAMGWFMLRVAEEFGHVSLMITGLAYCVAFLATGALLRFRRDLPVAGGLFFVLAVAMVPVVVFSLERSAGLWRAAYQVGEWIGVLPNPSSVSDLSLSSLSERLRTSWLLEEVATIVASVVALRYVRFPFLTAPLAFAVWHMAVFSIPDLLLPGIEQTPRLWVSVSVGLAMLLSAYLVDRRMEADFAFWGYLFGLLAFWGGLSLMHPEAEWKYLLYGLVNVALILIAVFLERRAFLVFGALGVFWYLAHLAYEVFSGSVLFPIALSFLGIGLIYLGVKYQQNREEIERFLRSRIPPSVRRLSPRQRQ